MDNKGVKGYIMNKYHPKGKKGMRFWILDTICGFVLSCDIIGLQLQQRDRSSTKSLIKHQIVTLN
jgi:hypothetical protein